MNHGFKINGNILEITLPEEVHIDKVLVNRQIFSQRQRVCESCKYHGLEGHEEPCVSCEVGNSNYVPSVELEERMEERTETHACDCVSRQAAIDAMVNELSYLPITTEKAYEIAEVLNDLPSVQQDVPDINVGKWIPCSERLPQSYVDVLVWFEYYRYGSYNRLYQTHGIGTYSENYESWTINHESGWHKLRVIAWMPLPQSYQPKEE